jgi:D-sedoheptulose 7-phosphate isomerase
VSFKSTVIRHQNMVEGLFALESKINDLVDKVEAALAAGNKVLFFGNGGSASDAQHLAAEFVVRYYKQRAPLAALALTTDTSILTAHGNDYSFDTLFDRQIQALAKSGDIAIGLSTSGNSGNVINGLTVAKDMGCWTCAFTGQAGGQLLSQVDSCIQVPSDETARVQEGHIIIGHWLCEALDQRLDAE